MRKIFSLILCFCLCLPLVACSKNKENLFRRDEDGNGYTNPKTGVHYVGVDYCFEPCGAGEVIGVYRDKKGISRTFSAVPGMDASLCVADEYLGVWYAGSPLPTLENFAPEVLLVCVEDAASVELFRYTKGDPSGSFERILPVWLTGAPAERPELSLSDFRVLKLSGSAFPGLYYVFRVCLYEDGSAFFLDPTTGRAVAVPSGLVSLIFPQEA